MEAPTVWPEGPNYSTISQYLNSLVMPAREAHNRMRLSQGKTAISLSDEAYWNSHYLPRYPDAGGSMSSVIGPWGVQGFGLHEFQGNPQIIDAVDAMNTLARSAREEPAPAPTPEPAPTPTPTPTPTTGGEPYILADGENPPAGWGVQEVFGVRWAYPLSGPAPTPTPVPEPTPDPTDKITRAVALAEELIRVLRS